VLPWKPTAQGQAALHQVGQHVSHPTEHTDMCPCPPQPEDRSHQRGSWVSKMQMDVGPASLPALAALGSLGTLCREQWGLPGDSPCSTEAHTDHTVCSQETLKSKCSQSLPHAFLCLSPEIADIYGGPYNA
jgi:hypothetical protein